jgi:hypothetical protein
VVAARLDDRPYYYACHLTLDDQPQLRQLVARYQRAVANRPGLDLIPPEWLHITMQGIGFTDEISGAELRRLTEALTQELRKIDPATVSFRYLTVHPEAIFLKAHPADALYLLRGTNAQGRHRRRRTQQLRRGHACSQRIQPARQHRLCQRGRSGATHRRHTASRDDNHGYRHLPEGIAP